jgi:adenylate kinase
MRVLMVAGPGAGKGTQAARLSAHSGVPHVSTGDLLRDHVARGTELGRRMKPYLDRGELVPDDVVLEMVRLALLVARDSGGYVLDGVPRTVPQAEATCDLALDLGLPPTAALHLQVEASELVRRLLTRAAAEGRSDDTEEVIRRRIDVYETETAPLLDWYRERGLLVSVAAMGTPDEVTDAVLDALESSGAL